MKTNRPESAIRIGGKPAAACDPMAFDDTEPSTGQPIAQLVGGGAQDAIAAASAAHEAFSQWSTAPIDVRAATLRAIAADLRDPNVAAKLAEITSRETGKLIAESEAEVRFSAAFFDWYAELITGRHDQTWNVSPNISHQVSRRPVGVVLAISAWNFPLSIPARKIAPALAAGCTVVFKPSEVAPLAALGLAELLDRHVPQGVVNTVLGDPRTIVASLLDDPLVRALSFTGSSAVGRLLARHASDQLIRCTLELGGNAPFVVLEDADIEDAAEVLRVAKFRNNGQSCIAANQVWVPGRVLQDFVETFAGVAASLTVGEPLDRSTSLGPLALATDPARIAKLLGDASRDGARIVVPSSGLPSGGHYAAPAICVDPPPNAAIVNTEIFGPALSIRPYDDVDEAINDVRSRREGLGGYVVGPPDRARQIAASLDVGIVGVNTGTPNTPQIPFGGRRMSGYGYEGGTAGIEQFEVYQSVASAG